jgi:peptidoglycan/LPS O-acetylase OafA/YrhL
MSSIQTPSQNTDLDVPATTSLPVLGYRPGLDIVRFLAALWVMFSHAGAVEGGGHAVSVFFVLSGFLIGGQLLKEKREANTICLREFYFKRVTRIWVPYFVVLAVMTVTFVARGQDAVPGFYDQAFGAFTYVYNLVNEVKGIHPTWVSFNQIWSLSIEEQFYLVAPLFVLLLPTTLFYPSTVLLGIFSLLYAPLYTGLFVGVLLAGIMERGTVHQLRPRTSHLLGMVAIAMYGLLFALPIWSVSQDSPWTYLVSAAIVAAASRVSTPINSHGVLRYLGLMTYSYYLIHLLPHYFLGAAVRRIVELDAVERIIDINLNPEPVWLKIIYGFIALPMSYLFVRFIELPCLRWRNRQLEAKSSIIGYAMWLAWGLNFLGLAGLAYIMLK